MTSGMIQALGLLAGITVMTASLPRALQSIRDRQKAKGEFDFAQYSDDHGENQSGE